jgi:hypothetical protein
MQLKTKKFLRKALGISWIKQKKIEQKKSVKKHGKKFY